jgi:hypothetical protein
MGVPFEGWGIFAFDNFREVCLPTERPEVVHRPVGVAAGLAGQSDGSLPGEVRR